MKILLLGDSLFAGYEGLEEPHINFSLKKILSGVKIQNLAQSGDNSFDLLEKLQKKQISGANLVFVWIGANDLATHKQVFLGEFQDNLRKIVKLLLKQYNSSQIIFLGPAPVDESKQVTRTNRLVNYYSEIVEKVAKEFSFDFISMQEVFRQSSYPVEQILKGLQDDGLHFGSLGYEVLAKALTKKIKTKF